LVGGSSGSADPTTYWFQDLQKRTGPSGVEKSSVVAGPNRHLNPEKTPWFPKAGRFTKDLKADLAMLTALLHSTLSWATST
jgi:hypothetical protein